MLQWWTFTYKQLRNIIASIRARPCHSDSIKAVMDRPIVIQIQFPALDSAIAYLRDHEHAQAVVDAATATIQQVTSTLELKRAALQRSIDKEK